jgi:hypothetical protein
MKASEEYSEAFQRAFDKPGLLTPRGLYLWADLEIVSDALAGPMYSVLKSGNHDYVYRDKENRFPGVEDAASFRIWAIGIVTEYRTSVLAFKPGSAKEGDPQIPYPHEHLL